MGKGSDRKHRSTGKAKGGKREGAGRTPGTPNTLKYGEVKAVKVARLRVPESASDAAAALADRALQRIIDVMEEDVGAFKAGMVLKAATRIREEVCGPVAQKLNIAGADGGPLQVTIEINRTVAAPPRFAVSSPVSLTSPPAAERDYCGHDDSSWCTDACPKPKRGGK